MVQVDGRPNGRRYGNQEDGQDEQPLLEPYIIRICRMAANILNLFQEIVDEIHLTFYR